MNLKTTIILILMYLLSSCASYSVNFPKDIKDNNKFPYTYYINKVVKKINKNYWPDGTKNKRVLVYFRIKRDGGILNEQIQVKETSGDDLFDQEAVKAVKISSPFPKLPKRYLENTLDVNFEFLYGDKK